VRTLFPSFHHFRMHVGRRPLEGSWSHPRGEGSPDDQGVGSCIGVRISGGLPGLDAASAITPSSTPQAPELAPDLDIRQRLRQGIDDTCAM
jgi:hypothetical protein